MPANGLTARNLCAARCLGVDATEQQTVPAALASQGASRYLLQHLVVSVDQPDSFTLQAADLYPLPVPAPTSQLAATATAAPPQLFWRSAQDGGRACVKGSDALASGCVSRVGNVSSTSSLFDATTAQSKCSQTPYAGG